MPNRPIEILLVDNYDSFTYNLYDYLAQLGAKCTVIRNNELTIHEIAALKFDGIVLSPGPKTPQEAGLLLQLIEVYHRKKPILGICLGHQGIGQFFGATLLRAKVPMHGKTSIIQHNEHPFFEKIPLQFEVMRYHSLILQSTQNTELDTIASTADGEIMAIAHQKLPIWGVQFHPESILTQHGLLLLGNWLKLVAKENTKKLNEID